LSLKRPWNVGASLGPSFDPGLLLTCEGSVTPTSLSVAASEALFGRFGGG